MKDAGRRPRILIGTPVYLPRQGGSSTYFSNLIRRLKGRVDLIVYTCRDRNAPSHEDKDGVIIHRIQPFLLDSPKPLRYLVLPPVTMLQLFRLRMKYGRFVIHAHSCGAYGYLISIYSRLTGQEMIKEVQDMADPAYSIRMGKVKKYVSTGTTIADQLRSFGIPEERIITYPSLNPDIPEKVKRKLVPRPYDHEGGMELLCISALRPYKGVDHLLRSMKMIQKRDPTIHLTIIGEGGMREELERYIRDNDLKNTKLMGFVDDYHDVLRMMAQCDILVLSSASAEGNPRVILESFQFARPVVATAAGGTPELIEDDVNGVLVPPKDPERFAEAVLELAGDPKRRKRLGMEGKRFLDRLPTWDDLAEDIYSEYVDIWRKM